MNQKLRARHRHMITLIAIVTPMIVGAALLTRPAPVAMPTLPAHGGNIDSAAAVHLSESSFLLDGTPLQARLSRATSNPQSVLLVELTPAEGYAISGADVLVYWHGGDNNGDTVPDDARLIGTLAGPQSRVFRLPISSVGGELLFYSLAQQRLYDERWALTE